jgi:DDE family transposase
VLVSHAPDTAVTSTDEKKDGKIPGLLEVLARVPDPRKRRGRRYLLVFILAVAVACALAGARNFREAGDHAADLPQEVLRRLGGRPHPLLRRITAPSETRIRTLIHAIGADLLDEIIGGWLRDLAGTGRLDGLLTAIAIDGKWLRGVLDGQVKLSAAMLHENKVIIAQHRIPGETTETTQVRELLETVDLDSAVVTADAVHAQRGTAEYIAGKKEDGNRESDYFLLVKGSRPSLQRAVFDAIQEQGPREPDHTELDYGHGRIIRRSIWVAGAGGIDFPHASRVARIRRDRYDADGTQISKEIVHAVTSLGTGQASAAGLAAIARGQWGIDVISAISSDVAVLEMS